MERREHERLMTNGVSVAFLEKWALRAWLRCNSCMDTYIPSTRERVCVSGRDGVFLVVAVNRESQTVDLIPLLNAANVLENVPFSVVSSYREEGLPEKK